MAAGTVISGGFPGRVAQEVQPNQKCSGCLHYDGQAGRTGACTIGLRPWLCGDEGTAQEIGYAPIDSGAGTYLPDMSNHGAHAAEAAPQPVSSLYGAGSTRGVQVQQVSLGEEHVHVVKSMVESHSLLQKSQCLLCSMRGTHGTAPANVGAQQCSCQPLAARDVAKALVPRMSNAQRAEYDIESLTEWVRDVAKAGFKMPRKARSLGSKNDGFDRDAEHKAKPGKLSPQLRVVDDPIGNNGGHLRRRDVAKSEIAATAVEKGYFGDDWLLQFKGTPFFHEAHALCEKDLEMEEARLKRREERTKHEKARSAALAKIKPVDYDWEKEDAERSKLGIAKQRLVLKLAKMRAGEVVKSSDFDVDLGKGTFYTTHGKYEVSPTGTSKRKVEYHPKTGHAPVHVGTFEGHKEAYRAAMSHSKHFAAGSPAPGVHAATGADEKTRPNKVRSPSLPSMSGAVSVAKKSHRDDVDKSIDDAKHSHIVTGKLAPSGRGYANVKMARNARDKMDLKYGAAAHSVKPNPNYKPSIQG